ncbi:MAG TPA: hypothetical protein VNW97_17380 [Candidatus Saccharimonadales bacterium]|jgi:hypothetical protein|nr:hypothetical protein [Candidatus Saccharimonadales bacterium]
MRLWSVVDKKSVLFLLLLFVMPSGLLAQTSAVGVRLADVSPPFGPAGPARLASTLNTDFTMFPSVTTSRLSPYGAGPQVLNLLAFCFNPFTGAILPNCDINLQATAANGSGGHVHNTNRPRGMFNPSSGNTGASGFLPVAYTSPEASGITNVLLFGFLNGVPITPGLFTIGVEFDGLQLANGTNLIVDTASQMHGNNNGFASSDMISAIQNLPGDFADLLAQSNGGTAPAVEFTALSLPVGGLFDFQNEWRPPHVSHRFGNDGDIAIRNLTRAQRAALARACTNDGFTFPVPGERPQDANATHWHIRLN